MGGEPFSSFFAAYVNSPPMGKAYEDMWRAWKDVGDGPFYTSPLLAESANQDHGDCNAMPVTTTPRADLATVERSLAKLVD